MLIAPGMDGYKKEVWENEKGDLFYVEETEWGTTLLDCCGIPLVFHITGEITQERIDRWAEKTESIYNDYFLPLGWLNACDAFIQKEKDRIDFHLRAKIEYEYAYEVHQYISETPTTFSVYAPPGENLLITEIAERLVKMLDETLYVQTQEAYEAHIEQEAYVRMVRYGSLAW